MNHLDGIGGIFLLKFRDRPIHRFANRPSRCHVTFQIYYNPASGAFEETTELMKLVIAGIRSREQGGQEIFLKDIL
jgi:hypothetical protein